MEDYFSHLPFSYRLKYALFAALVAYSLALHAALRQRRCSHSTGGSVLQSRAYFPISSCDFFTIRLTFVRLERLNIKYITLTATSRLQHMRYDETLLTDHRHIFP